MCIFLLKSGRHISRDSRIYCDKTIFTVIIIYTCFFSSAECFLCYRYGYEPRRVGIRNERKERKEISKYKIMKCFRIFFVLRRTSRSLFLFAVLQESLLVFSAVSIDYSKEIAYKMYDYVKE